MRGAHLIHVLVRGHLGIEPFGPVIRSKAQAIDIESVATVSLVIAELGALSEARERLETIDSP
jgi:hypothetical protein